MIANSVMKSSDRMDCERAPDSDDPGGFTLIELLIMIVIIGVIAAIGTPQLLGMRTRSSVRADARDIHSAYRQAQTEAVKRFFVACLDVDADASTYQIQIADYFGTGIPSPPTGSPADNILEGESTMLLEKKLRPGNTIDVPKLACFNTRGLPVEGTGTIEISNPSLTMEVTLTPSGHVKSTNQ